jgi:hypothetical protein
MESMASSSPHDKFVSIVAAVAVTSILTGIFFSYSVNSNWVFGAFSAVSSNGRLFGRHRLAVIHRWYRGNVAYGVKTSTEENRKGYPGFPTI